MKQSLSKQGDHVKVYSSLWMQGVYGLFEGTAIRTTVAAADVFRRGRRRRGGCRDGTLRWAHFIQLSLHGQWRFLALSHSRSLHPNQPAMTDWFANRSLRHVWPAVRSFVRPFFHSFFSSVYQSVVLSSFIPFAWMPIRRRTGIWFCFLPSLLPIFLTIHPSVHPFVHPSVLSSVHPFMFVRPLHLLFHPQFLISPSFLFLSSFLPSFFSHSLLYLYFLHWSYIPPYIPLFTNLFSLLIFLPSFCIPLRRTGIIIMILIPSILPSHFLSFFLLSSFFHSLFSLCWILLSIYLPILQLFLMFSSSRDVARRKYWGLMISWGLHWIW